MKKRVYVAYTGGTIGMTPTPEGYAPAPGYLVEQIAVQAAASDALARLDVIWPEEPASEETAESG